MRVPPYYSHTGPNALRRYLDERRPGLGAGASYVCLVDARWSEYGVFGQSFLPPFLCGSVLRYLQISSLSCIWFLGIVESVPFPRPFLSRLRTELYQFNDSVDWEIVPSFASRPVVLLFV